MNNIKLVNLISLFIGLFFIMSCNGERNIVKILTHNENQREFLRNIVAYNNYDVKIVENKNYLIIKDIKIEMLFEILNMVKIKMDVISDNIANVNTTMTEKGVPYKRKYMEITMENGIEIIEDMKNYPRLVYDPSHPDSIKDGEWQGYVEYPNTNIVAEMTDLTEANRQYESILEYIKNNYTDVIIF